MKKIKFQFLLFFIIVNISFARLPGTFIDIGYGARAQGMAGVFVSIADDVYTTIWNPAGLSKIQKKEITIMGTKQFGLVPYVFGGFVYPLTKEKKEEIENIKKEEKKDVVIKKTFIKSFKDLIKADTQKGFGVNFIVAGDTALQEFTLAASYGQLVKEIQKIKIYGGTNLKLRTSSVGNNSDGGDDKTTGSTIGFGCDFGVLCDYDQFSVGMLLRDLFVPLISHSNIRGSYIELVPMTICYGGKYKINKDILVALQMNGLSEFCTGMEARLYEIFFARFGIKKIFQENNKTNIYTVGCGIKYPLDEKIDVTLDISYEFRSYLANTLIISTNFIF